MTNKIKRKYIMKIQLNTEVKDTDMGCYIDPTTGIMYSINT